MSFILDSQFVSKFLLKYFFSVVFIEDLLRALKLWMDMLDMELNSEKTSVDLETHVLYPALSKEHKQLLAGGHFVT